MMRSCFLPDRLFAVRSIVGLASLIAAATSSAWAQSNSVQTALVRQDFSDCNNGDVHADDASRIGGSVSIGAPSNGSVAISVTFNRGTPNTTYHFFWKCNYLLGNVTTDASGNGSATLSIESGRGVILTPGTILAFDSYPDGAPPGNKFQSVAVAIPR